MASLLVSMLNISQGRAEQLLAESGGNIETAVALHFSRAGPSGAPALGRESPRSQLRAIVGGSQVSLQQAAALLQRAGGSVEAAADLFFSQQEEAGPSSAAAREQSEPISIDSDRCAGQVWGCARRVRLSRAFPAGQLKPPPGRGIL
jgi:hypothetical protein